MASINSQKEIEAQINNYENFSKIIDSLTLSLKQNEAQAANENKAGITSSLKALKEQNDELKKSIADKNSELTNIKNNIAKNSSTNWELPTFGNSTQFKADEVLILCSQFGGLEDGDFEIFYRKFCNFVNCNKLNEDTAKTLLSGLLKKDSFDCFYEIKDESFQTIINTLGCRYSPAPSILHYANQLKNITRQPGEHLFSFINKAKILIQKSSRIVPKDQQSARQNFILGELLFKFSSPEAKQKIQAEQIRLARNGLVPNFQDLLDLAVYTEEDSKNSADGLHNGYIAAAAIRDDGITKRREMRKHSPIGRRISDVRSDVRNRIPSPSPQLNQSREQSPFKFEQQNFEQKQVPQQQFYHGTNSQNYNAPNAPKQFRSYSPPPNENRNYSRHNGYGRQRGFRFNHLATQQLSDLICKLTDIFNILTENPKQ